MAPDKLYVLDAQWKGSQAVKKAEADLDKLDQTAGQKVPMSFSKMALGIGAGVAAFGAVTIAAKAAWDALGEGSELIKLQSQFDNLATSIDTTSESLKSSLSAATSGMVSDADLISASSDIISMRLATTEDGVVRLAAATSQLGTDMNQLTMTMLNDSTMRLDQLGLSATRVKEIQDDLKANGFVGDAFDEAVIIALEERVTLLGDASETTAGDVKKIEASIQNVKNAGLIAFTEGAAGGLHNMALASKGTELALIDLANRAGEAFGGIIAGLGAVMNAWDSLPDGLKAVAFGGVGIAAHEVRRGYNAAFGGGYQDPRANENWRGTRARSLASRDAANYAPPPVDPIYGYSGNMFTGATSGYSGGMNQNEMIAWGNEVDETGEKMRRLGIQQEYVTEKNEALNASITTGAGGFSSYRSEADQLAQELFGLAAATGDYYAQAERAEEVDPIKALRDSMRAHGASAYEQYLFDIASGLKSVEEAQKDLDNAYVLQQADQFGALLAQGFSAEEALAAVQDVTVDTEEYFRTLDEATNQDYETVMSADTSPAEQAIIDLIAWANQQSATLTVYANTVTTPGARSNTAISDGFTSGSSITINNHTRAAAAASMSIIRQQSRAAQIASMGSVY